MEKQREYLRKQELIKAQRENYKTALSKQNDERFLQAKESIKDAKRTGEGFNNKQIEIR